MSPQEHLQRFSFVKFGIIRLAEGGNLDNYKFRNPPLVEAVCEFRFDVDDLESKLLPVTRFLDKLKEEYTKGPIPFKSVEMELTTRGPLLRPEPPPKFKLTNEAATRVIVASGNTLNINHVHADTDPYPGWSEFKKRALRHLKKFVGHVSPKGIVQIGVRYIDRINTEPPERVLSDVLNKNRWVPEVVLSGKIGCSSRVEKL